MFRIGLNDEYTASSACHATNTIDALVKQLLEWEKFQTLRKTTQHSSKPDYRNNSNAPHRRHYPEQKKPIIKNTTTIRCLYCGNTGHIVTECRMKKFDVENGILRSKHPRYEENLTKRYGHYNKPQDTKQRTSTQTKPTSNYKTVENNATLVLEKVKTRVAADYYGPITNGTINAQPIQFLVDSGAAATFIAEDVAKQAKLKISNPLNAYKTKIANGSSQETIGQTSFTLETQGHALLLTAFVIKNLTHDLILGYDMLTHFKSQIDASKHT
ncbi:hypothetical protein HMI55_005514, partial [Coelomomyces lativittatus]